MKNVILKITSALCVIISVILFFFTSTVVFSNIRGSEVRAFRKEILANIDNVKDDVVERYEYDRFVEEMEDNELPETKGAAKRRIREVRNTFETLLDGKISIMDIVNFSSKAPGLIIDTENLLETDFAKAVLKNAGPDAYEEVSDTMDYISDITFPFEAIIAFFAILALLGIVSAVLSVFNKASVVKWIYFIILTLVVVAISIGVSLISPELPYMLNLTGDMEDMIITTTASPYLSVVFALASVILGIVIKKKEKKTAKQPVEV